MWRTFIRNVVGASQARNSPALVMRWADATPRPICRVCPAHAQSYRTQSIDDARPHDRTPFEHSAAESFWNQPVVMKRSIPDMLCSYADMLETEGRYPDGSYNWSILCGVHTDQAFFASMPMSAWTFSSTINPLVHPIYASWLRADRNKSLPVPLDGL